MTDTPISNVSDTSLWVAAFRALENERPDALFHDPLAATLTGERGRAIAREMPYPKILAWVMAVRTVAIDRLIFEAIGAGIDTVINIGAGLDTRPYRLDLPENLRWIEIDFPHIIELKNSKLSQTTPRCQTSRIAFDVSNRSAARTLYHDLGLQSKKALIITEGVITYLSIEEAGNLAEDLRAIPSFHFWIQDYRKANKKMQHPEKLKKKLKNAPFRFDHSDPLGFFGEYGWKVRDNINAFEEGEKFNRPFPMSFPWNIMMRFIPSSRRNEFRQMLGYVLLEVK